MKRRLGGLEPIRWRTTGHRPDRVGPVIVQPVANGQPLPVRAEPDPFRLRAVLGRSGQREFDKRPGLRPSSVRHQDPGEECNRWTADGHRRSLGVPRAAPIRSPAGEGINRKWKNGPGGQRRDRTMDDHFGNPSVSHFRFGTPGNMRCGGHGCPARSRVRCPTWPECGSGKRTSRGAGRGSHPSAADPNALHPGRSRPRPDAHQPTTNLSPASAFDGVSWIVSPRPQITWHKGPSPATERKLLKQRLHDRFTGLSGPANTRRGPQQVLTRQPPAYVLDGDNDRFGLNAGPKILMETRNAPGRGLSSGLPSRRRTGREHRRIGRSQAFRTPGLSPLQAHQPVLEPGRRPDHPRKEQGQGHPVLEIHVSTAIDVCEQRDPKGSTNRPAAASGKGWVLPALTIMRSSRECRVTIDGGAETTQQSVAKLLQFYRPAESSPEFKMVGSCGRLLARRQHC